MKKFSVCVTETFRVYYTVEANSEEEAKELIENCPDHIEEEINRDIERGYQGREIGVVPAEPDEKLDYTYEQLKGDD